MPVVFVIKLQLSKISVKTSKGHKYFEEFTLWILIKHILIFNIHSRIKSFFPASLINWAGYAQHIFESNMYGHFIPIDILPYGHFQIHQIFMDISLLWTICHMVFLHIDRKKLGNYSQVEIILPQRIYNPIITMGVLAMFTSKL